MERHPHVGGDLEAVARRGAARVDTGLDCVHEAPKNSLPGAVGGPVVGIEPQGSGEQDLVVAGALEAELAVGRAAGHQRVARVLNARHCLY